LILEKKNFYEKLKGNVGKYEINIIGNEKIPYAKNGKHYLEAFGGWNVPKGKIKGILYNIGPGGI